MSNMSGTGKVFPRSRTGTEKRNEKMKKELKKNKKRNQQNNMTKPSGSNFLPEKFSRSCGLNALTGPGIRGPVIVANHSPRSVRLGRFPQIFLFPRLCRFNILYPTVRENFLHTAPGHYCMQIPWLLPSRDVQNPPLGAAAAAGTTLISCSSCNMAASDCLFALEPRAAPNPLQIATQAPRNHFRSSTNGSARVDVSSANSFTSN